MLLNNMVVKIFVNLEKGFFVYYNYILNVFFSFMIVEK